MIHYTTEMVREYPNYNCPPYCDINHIHIGKNWDELYNGMVGTTDSLHFACSDTDPDESGYRCFEIEGQDTIRIME